MNYKIEYGVKLKNILKHLIMRLKTFLRCDMSKGYLSRLVLLAKKNLRLVIRIRKEKFQSPLVLGKDEKTSLI